MRGHEISSSMIREIVMIHALERIEEFMLLNPTQLDDTYHSLMFLGPPGVGKTVLQYVSAKDVAEVLSSIVGTRIEVSKVSVRITPESAAQIAQRVIEGRSIPYVHLYLPQTKIWNLEGTPSPMDSFVDIEEVKIPINVWRVDPFLIPLMDYRDVVKDKRRIVPGFLVLDEFNMAENDVLRKLFQLSRSAELGRCKLNPLTVISLVGNTPETNIASSRYIADPLIDRSEVYIVKRPDVQGWVAYMSEMYGDMWDKSVAAYLTLNPKEIYVQGGDGPSGGSGVIQTPRDFTIFSVRLYVLKRLVERGVIGKDAFWRRVESLAGSLFTRSTANSIIGFLRGLQVVNVDAVIRNPDIITQFDRNVAAYCLLMSTSMLANKYRESPEHVRERILETLAALTSAGSRALGPEAVSIVLSLLPVPVRIALERKMSHEVLNLSTEARRVIRELEEALMKA